MSTSSQQVHEIVRTAYGSIARDERRACCAPPTSSAQLGYDAAALAAVPVGADLGLGCGNPIALAALRPGERVVDLGSGGGLDVFLAAAAVGPTGFVTGVDMTPEMVQRARRNAANAGITNVAFELGQIEALPLADSSADVVISNCVINLAPDKLAVFREAHRVLAPGGRAVVSDIVLRGELPEAVRRHAGAYVMCVSGAAQVDDYVRAMTAAGFEAVEILEEKGTNPTALAADPLFTEIASRLGAADVAAALRAVRHLVVRGFRARS
ncbi:MAG: arsenite methyltransferase [Candidatus Schekmanbacteria bacterium]|nr:arsenite methyltransferase [Candidatus Schekmanbacteria bacterium]